MKKIKSNKAITLIALVITIVVLIILAAVAINLSLGNNGIFNRAKTAKEQYTNAQEYEQTVVGKATDDISRYVDGNRGTVTLTQEEYTEFKRKGYTLLWEGVANKTGTTDNSGNEYKFKNTDMDVDNYDFVLIEYHQSDWEDSLYSSVMISKKTINKTKRSNISLFGWGQRYTGLHFVNNGFIVDEFSSDNTCYEYMTSIWGVNM